MVKIEKRPQASEVRDLFHLMYAYDVDLISEDSRMGEIIKADSSLRGKVVSKIGQLSNAFEKKFEELNLQSAQQKQENRRVRGDHAPYVHSDGTFSMRVSRWMDECGQSLGRSTNPCFTGFFPTILNERCIISGISNMMFPKPPLSNPAL